MILLDKEVTLARIEGWCTTTSLSFYLEPTDDSCGCVFMFYDDTLTISITKHNASIKSNKDVFYINEDIKLDEDTEYCIECGVKTDAVYEYLVLYLRILD
jgi:hypothetical protein